MATTAFNGKFIRRFEVCFHEESKWDEFRFTLRINTEKEVVQKHNEGFDFETVLTALVEVRFSFTGFYKFLDFPQIATDAMKKPEMFLIETNGRRRA